MQDDLRKRKKDWERDVRQMKEEFLRLYPAELIWGSEELLSDHFVKSRRGSTDILDRKKLKTMFLEYPDTSKNFKLRFDLMEYDPDSVRVKLDGDRIVVRASKQVEEESGEMVSKEFIRKVEKPIEIQALKLKSFLTTDGILVVEAPLPPHTLGIQRLTSSPSRISYGTSSHSSQENNTSSAHSTHSHSPSGSPSTPSSSIKEGMPIFSGEEGERSLTLIVDIGTAFKPKDVTVQIIKDNRIQIKAKHEERTSERLCKNKYFKEYELQERIETYSMRAAMTDSGKLIIGALGKGHSGYNNNKTDAGENVAKDVNSKANPGSKPCSVLDLANFPPTNNPMLKSTDSSGMPE